MFEEEAKSTAGPCRPGGKSNKQSSGIGEGLGQLGPGSGQNRAALRPYCLPNCHVTDV